MSATPGPAPSRSQLVAAVGESRETVAQLADVSSPRVRVDQPTIATLEETMAAAQSAAETVFTEAGFYRVHLVINVVATSLDPDDDRTTWSAGSRVPGVPGSGDRSMLAASLRTSTMEAFGG